MHASNAGKAFVKRQYVSSKPFVATKDKKNNNISHYKSADEIPRVVSRLVNSENDDVV